MMAYGERLRLPELQFSALCESGISEVDSVGFSDAPVHLTEGMVAADGDMAKWSYST